MAKLVFDCVLVPSRSRSAAPSPKPQLKRESVTPAPDKSVTRQRPSRLRTSVKLEESADSDSSPSSLAPSDDEASKVEREVEQQDSEDDDPSFQLSGDDEERPPKRRRTASPVVVKEEEPEVRIKLEDGEDEKKVLQAPPARKVRPRHRDFREGHIRFMPTTIPDKYTKADATVAMMKSNGGFRRVVMRGPPQAGYWGITYWKLNPVTNEDMEVRTTRPSSYEVPRLCLRANLQIGCRGPGYPFIAPTSLDSTPDGEYAMFIQENSNEDESWRPYGIYKSIDCGPALDGEFAALDDLEGGPETQQAVISALVEYLRSDVSVDFSEGLFEDTVREDGQTRDGVDIVRSCWDDRKTANPAKQRAAIEKALRANNGGIKIAYHVYVYVRPITDAEMGDCNQLRALWSPMDRVKRARKALDAALDSWVGTDDARDADAQALVDELYEEWEEARVEGEPAQEAWDAELARRKQAAIKEAREYAAAQAKKKRARLKEEKEKEEAERARLERTGSVKPEGKDEDL
ncbi:hypothetical protein JCM10450v2_002513 [Rhodotorula kratochvilovae]